MATQSKKPFKLNVLGLFSIETEDLSFKQKLIVMIIVMLFMLAVIVLLKVYAIPVLSTSGIIKKTGSIINFFKSRSP